MSAAWDEAKHPRNPHTGEWLTAGGPAHRRQQSVSTVKQLTSGGKLDYNPNLRAHLDSVTAIADVADKIPAKLRPQLAERIDRIKVESNLSVPGYQTPLGSSVAGFYEPDSHELHVAADPDVGHVVMHEMQHALDNDLQGGHRFSSRRDWLALCRGIWGSDYAKTHARSYFVPSGPADMARAARETFAELLACHFEGKPLSLTYSGKTPLPPELEGRVRDYFTSRFGAAGTVSRAVVQASQSPLCVGVKRRDGAVEFVSVPRRKTSSGHEAFVERTRELCRMTGIIR